MQTTNKRTQQRCRICLNEQLRKDECFSLWQKNPPFGEGNKWNQFLLETMQLRLPGHFHVPSMVCKDCNDSLRTAFKIFNLGKESTLFLTRQQNKLDAQLALISKNGDSAASLQPAGTKTYFSNDDDSTFAAMDTIILQKCNQLDKILDSEPGGDSRGFGLPNKKSLIEKKTVRSDVDQVRSERLAAMQKYARPTEKLSSENIGFKMLEKQGWTGGSIGKNEDGIAEPVSVTMKSNRAGIGSSEDQSALPFGYQNVLEYLSNFKLRNTDVDVMVLGSDFTEREIKYFKACCCRLRLKYEKSCDKYGPTLRITYKYT